MESRDWADAERSFSRPGSELGRLLRRCRYRLGVAILLAAGAAAVATAFLATRAAKHEAQVILRVSEGVISDGQGMPSGELRGYVESALLTRALLLEIIESEDLFPAARARGDQYAIDELRSALELEIYGNFFASWDRAGPASLRIRVTYRSGDREEAAAVARALARMIARAEIDKRRWRFEKSSERSESVIARVRHHIEERERELRGHYTELRRAERQHDRIRAGTLRLQATYAAENMQDDHRELREAVLSQDELEFRRAAAHERLGILFTVVERSIPAPPRWDPYFISAAVGGVVFVLAFPLAAIAAAAFDRRLHEPEDVARLGIEPLGRLPRVKTPRRGA